jgi:SAM-dependent methyltransferase
MSILIVVIFSDVSDDNTVGEDDKMTIVDFYNDFYEKAEKSHAHAVFCERVYGINLCQHGMADDDQIMLMLEELELDETSNVLDLGCGPGLISGDIQKKTNCRLVGLDISPVAIERADAHFGQQNLKLQFHVGDMASYEAKEELFDAILLIDTHYFIEDFLSMIPKLLGRLKEGGKIAIFSDEGKGIEGLDESQTQPHETIIGQYLTTNGIRFKGIRLYEENRAHWEKKKVVLLDLKESFEQENNLFIYNNRLGECNDHDRTLDGRYLYIIPNLHKGCSMDFLA